MKRCIRKRRRPRVEIKERRPQIPMAMKPAFVEEVRTSVVGPLKRRCRALAWSL
jgi:hypothetical protein